MSLTKGAAGRRHELRRKGSAFFNGWLVIFPIIGPVFMMLAASMMLGFWGRNPRRGTGKGPMRMMAAQIVRFLRAAWGE